MGRLGRCERLRGLCAELAEAVARGDLRRIGALDHLVRSAVMGMLGEGAPDGPAATEELSALSAALAALGDAVQALRREQGRALRQSGARARYLSGGDPR
jgi:hypothetical protein